MKHGSLFSGIGGFDYAAQMMGWENVFHCEKEPFCKKVLTYYWPNAISHDDIKQTDFSIHRGSIDVLTGGFPCQPYSTAGQRKGKEDARHLWPEMLRSVREIQPRWIVGENVRGLISWNGGLVFDEVQADLEAEGYEVYAFLLPACGVNAPHRRERIWFVAYSNSHRQSKSAIARNDQREFEAGKEKGSQFSAHCQKSRASRVIRTATDSKVKNDGRCESAKKERQAEQLRDRSFEDDVTNATSLRRVQSINGNQPGFNNESSENDSWENFPTQPPVCGGNDGLPRQLDGITFSRWRRESIKAYGNAIVPQVALQIFKAIEEYQNIQ